MQYAEKIFLNGNIYTVNEDAPHAEAIAICGDRLLFVGSNDAVKQYQGPDTVITDFAGRTVIPGIMDNHIHIMIAGANIERLDCVGKSREEILSMVEKDAKTKKPGEWVMGFGWDQSPWIDTTLPTRQELDAVSPNNPVYLERVCGHCQWISSSVLEMAGVTRETPNPVGGEFLRDENGDPTGFVTESACSTIDKVLPKPTLEDYKRRILRVQDHMLSNGITSAADKGIGAQCVGEEPNIELGMEAFRQIGDAGLIKARFNEYVQPYPALEPIYRDGWPLSDYNGKLVFCGTKEFADGALGARSAWLCEPYEDRPDHTGEGRWSTEYIAEKLKQAHDAGYHMSLHAIGDAAVKQALDAYEMANPEHEDWHFVIEHFMVVRPEDFERIKTMKIVASMQYVELSTDLVMIEKRVGKIRAEGAYAWRKVLDTGTKIAAGTDHPMDYINPFENMYFGVSRCCIRETPKGGWHPSQGLTRYEVLRSYTLDSAYAVNRDHELGSLEVGKYADFTVIDKDYMNCEVKEIKNIKPLATYVGGELMYSAE